MAEVKVETQSEIDVNEVTEKLKRVEIQDSIESERTLNITKSIHPDVTCLEEASYDRDTKIPAVHDAENSQRDSPNSIKKEKCTPVAADLDKRVGDDRKAKAMKGELPCKENEVII